MKVVEIAYAWPAETFIQRHVQALQEFGVDILLVTRSNKEPSQTSASLGEQNPEVPKTIFPYFGQMNLKKKIWHLRHLLLTTSHFKTNKNLKRKAFLAFIERLKPDLIHFHTALYAASMAWIPLALDIPYTVSVRGSDVQVTPLHSPDQREKIVQALRGVALSHTVCDHLGQVAEYLCGDFLPVRTIYTTVPIPSRIPDYESPEKGLHFVSVGRFQWMKAYPDLLRALASLKAQGYSARLTLIGQGREEPRISWWVNHLGLEENVELLGKIPSSKLLEMYSQATALVQSSMAEGFSNVVAEAMAWGCPVFATSVGGTAELIRDGENGFLLPPLQPERWAQKLIIAQDRDIMQQVRENAYETACQTFSPQRHTQAFAAFFEEALKQDILPSPAEPAPLTSGKEGERASKPSSDTEMSLLVQGEWHWKNGADQVLRACVPAARAGQLHIIFQGDGPQEDELRYLVNFLGIDGCVNFLEDEPTQECEVMGQEWESKVVLGINDAQNKGWCLFQNDLLLTCVTFGNQEILRDCIMKLREERINQ